MFRFDVVVRYSEIGEDGHITAPAVLDLMQDCCIFHSEEIGVGVDFLQKADRAWVLSSWNVVFSRYPKMGERLTVSTWPYDFKRFLGSRNFKVEDAHGNVVAWADSLWTYLDTQNLVPARVPEEIRERYVLEPRYQAGQGKPGCPADGAEDSAKARKIQIRKEMEAKEPIRFAKFFIDTNRHMNNGKYVMLAEEYLPSGFKVGKLRAEYKKAAVLADLICPKVKQESGRVVVSLENEAGEPYAAVEFGEDK